MALLRAEPPNTLYRIGRAPEPVAWPSWEHAGRSRFDDPDLPPRFRVMYAAESRLGCFLETLAPWRKQVSALLRLALLPEGDAEIRQLPPSAGGIPADWHERRLFGTFRLDPGQVWLDLRRLETRETLRRPLAPLLDKLGIEDFDLGDAVSRIRPLTQQIAALTYEAGFHGIVYHSRFDASVSCWAVFEGASLERQDVWPVAVDDPDFLTIARLFGLVHEG
jgi:RES domain